jgi:hypothetical protein
METRQVDVGALEGAQLDWAVAVAEDYADIDIIDHIPIMDEAPPSWCKANGHPFSPSSSWTHGGPIIEREQLLVQPLHGSWFAHYRLRPGCHGKTPLIAAMRAFVLAKLGDSVEVPEPRENAPLTL